MDKKILRNDIILVSSLLLTAVISLVCVFSCQKKTSNVAFVYVQNELKEEIPLYQKLEKDYYVDGLKGQVHIHTKDGAIAIVESNCPHQDCVNMGYVNVSNKPIICAYNAVYIIIKDGVKASYDVEI